MKALNNNSTLIFLYLLKAMNGKDHIKIINEPYNPVVLERIGRHSYPLWGDASLYSLCQYYTQCGDLMQDPEMCFILSEDRQRIYPTMYQQANMGIYQQSVLLEQVPRFHRVQQAEHAVFADQWLHNIKNQGFLDQIDHGKVLFSA